MQQGAIAALCLLAVCAVAWRQQQILSRTYRVGYTDLPELFQVRASAKPGGFAVDLLEAAAERSGVRVVWVYSPEGSESALLEGKVDLWPYLHQKDYLKSRVHFSRPYLDSELSLLHLQGVDAPPASGSRVAIPDGKFFGYISSRLFPASERFASTSDREMLSQLCNGSVDFALVRRGRVVLLAEEWRGICQSPLPRIQPVSSPELTISFASTMDAAPVADRLRDGLDEVLAERPIETFSGFYYLEVDAGNNLDRAIRATRSSNQWLMLWLCVSAVFLLAAILFCIWFVRSNRRLRDVLADRERLMAEVRRAEETKVHFIANMSHELCTPMNGIQGAVELLRDSGLGRQQEQLLNTAAESSRTLMALIRQLLDFSQLESNQVQLDDRPFSVQEIVEAIAQVSCVAAAAKGLAYTLSIDPAAAVWLKGDPLRVRRVIECLLSNAVKFTVTGRVRLRVLAPPAGSDDALIVEVSDTGTGVPAELQSRIFEAFEQADSSMTRQYGGLGIGLATALRLARKMGGRVTLESPPGEGARFAVHLPASMLCPVPAGQSPFRPGRSGKTRRRAVVIHRDEEVREAIRVTVAASGLGVVGLEMLPTGGLVGDSISYVFVEEEQLERCSPSWPPRTRVVLLYQRAAIQRAMIPGRGISEIASPFLPSEIRHLLSGGSFASGSKAPLSAPGQKSGEGLGLHVLLVDDSPTNLKIAEQILRRMGCAVTTAENGEQAIETLQSAQRMGTPVDVVLMDCQMPVLDGYEATRRIRHSPEAFRAIPIIAFTAHIGPHEREHCLAAGMTDYTTKPINRQAIWRLLQRYGSPSSSKPIVRKEDGCSISGLGLAEMGQSAPAGRNAPFAEISAKATNVSPKARR